MAKVYDNATDIITFARGSSGTALRRVGYGDDLAITFSKTGDNGTNTITLYDDGYDINQVDASSIAQVQINGTFEANKTYVLAGDYTVSSGGFKIDQSNLAGGSITVSGYTVFRPLTAVTSIGIYRNVIPSAATFRNISVREVFFDRATDPLVLFSHPDDTPRIEYGSDGSLKGLLIEEQRTNLVMHSEDLNLSFASLSGVSIEPAAATEGPISAAQRMVADTSTGFHRAAGTALVQNSTDYTFSCFFKADGQNVCGLSVYTGTSFAARASFDLSTVQETVSNGSATIKSVGGGWYHCAVTGATTGTTATVYIYVNSLFSATGDDTSGVFVYGAQLEAGSFPTSYIPTSGSQQTRSADIASIPVSAFGYNQDAGSLLVDVNTFDNDYGNWVWELDGSSDTSLYAHGAGTGWRLFGAGGTIAYLGTLPANASANIGYAYDHIGSSALIDGGSITAQTFGQPVNVATLKIGATGPISRLNGHIKSLKYYPRRLTNTQLQELTA